MLANMLMFGVLANTVENFAHGRLDRNFMPEFDDFSTWDDVVHPFFLSIGVYVSSFGPLILVVVIGGYFAFSAASEQRSLVQSEVEKVPGTQLFDTKRAVDQSDQVKALIDDVKKGNAERLNNIERLEHGNADESQRQTNLAQPDTLEAVQKASQGEAESVLGKSPEKVAGERTAMLQAVLGLAGPFFVLASLALLWALFYFPAACAVAGYTRSFTAAINPMVGLDTIKRIGGSYLGLVVMSAAIFLISGAIGLLLSAIFSPLDLPTFGNVPAKVIGSFVSFYFVAAFSCLVGFALLKASPRLGLSPSGLIR